jgi:hypothetical protein
MFPLHPVDWEILNATADDCENLEQIYLAVCFEFMPAGEGDGAFRRLSASVPLSEVADRLRNLVGNGLLNAVTDDGRPSPDYRCDEYVWKAWFAMTVEGRRLWAAASPADLMERK